MRPRAFLYIAVLLPLFATSLDLPGPAFFGKITVLLHTVTLVVTAFGVFFILPAASLWTLVECWRRWRGITQRFNSTPVMVICLVGIAVASVTVVREFTRRAASERAIRRAAPLIDALQTFQQASGHYPHTLEAIAAHWPGGVPTPGSMGSPSFGYELRHDAYDLSFAQCDNLICFNPWVYVFNPNGQQTGRGDYPQLYETGHPHWRYYVYD